MNKVMDILIESIKTKKEAMIVVKSGLNTNMDIFIQPYLIGDDFFQNRFVWGYVDLNKTFVKVLIEKIQEASIVEIPYKVLSHAIYLFSINEDLWHVLDDFDKIYDDSTIPKEDETQ